jgi:N-6 DNA Methylase
MDELFDQFLNLVRRVFEGRTGRSENDLSARLSRIFEGIGLHTVVDTRVSSGGRKRPDILAYVSEQDAHLVLPAEVVIEAKKPDEVAGFRNLAEAMVSDRYWADKTYPYLRDNIARVRYFAFTTFTEFSVFSVTQDVRQELAVAFAVGDVDCRGVRDRIRTEALSFKLYETERRGPSTARGWMEWVVDHLRPQALLPIPFSSIRNSVPLVDAEDLETLATKLATFAAGSGDPDVPDSGLFNSIRRRVSGSFTSLPEEIRDDLLLFAMSQHPTMDVDQAGLLVRENLRQSLDEFVASSIHSLISRLFAINIIEDVYCVGAESPLIEPDKWLFTTDAYDPLEAEEIRTEVFRRIRALKLTTNPLMRRFAEYGFFFDWIEKYVDPVLFRSLIETFATHDFSRFEGDLLGRFYELYSQQINKTRRRELGQYYTPLAIVQFMWRRAGDLIVERRRADELMVLDPAMGSATFLAEGARALARMRVPRFWDRLTGFDVSPQVLGIAHVNVYMAILSQMDPEGSRDVEGLRLYVTDTLDREYGSHLREILPVIDPAHRAFLEQRVAISTQAKRESSYRLVIGNPPYKNNSNLTLNQVAQRFPNLLASSVEHGGAQRRNIRDDYAWFVAAADYYIEGQGVLCYILSDSFATHQSYEHFRVEVLRNFHVRVLVRLGSNVFPDVGYRTSFAIILLEKRREPIGTSDVTEPIPYTDLRPLIEGTPTRDLCTPRDPRLAYLLRVSRGEADLTVTENHIPSRDSRYSFYPGGSAVARFHVADAFPVHERGVDRIFLQKWPGIITAFDPLISGDTREEVEERMSSFFDLCQTPGVDEHERGQLLNAWGRERGFRESKLSRLRHIGTQVAEAPRGTLNYDPRKVKRTFSNTMAEDARWYPPARNVNYLYYETVISDNYFSRPAIIRIPGP